MLNLLTLSEAADHLGCHPDTLKRWGPDGPTFTRTAGGHRRYDIVDLDAWLEARRTRSRIVPRRDPDIAPAQSGDVLDASWWRDPALPTKAARAEAEAQVKRDLAHLL